MIETVMEPNFVNNTDYPLMWKNAEHYTWEQLGDEQKDEEETLRSFSQITYKAAGEISDNSWNFIKKMSALNQYWVDVRDWNIGLDHTVEQEWIWSIYIDPENPCSVITMVYPGTNQEQELRNYDEDGCLDIKKEYPWLYARSKEDRK